MWSQMYKCFKYLHIYSINILLLQDKLSPKCKYISKAVQHLYVLLSSLTAINIISACWRYDHTYYTNMGFFKPKAPCLVFKSQWPNIKLPAKQNFTTTNIKTQISTSLFTFNHKCVYSAQNCLLFTNGSTDHKVF